MKFQLKQKVDLSEYEHQDYNKQNMPIIISEITRLAEEFFDDVLEENFSCSLIPMDGDATLYLVVELNLTDKEKTSWQMSVDEILDQCLDEACVNGKDKAFLKKMRDALSRQVEKVDLWMELMDKND